MLAAVAAVAVAGVVVAVVATGGTGSSRHSTSAGTHSGTTKASTSATRSRAAGGGSGGTSAATSAATATGVVKAFYEDAAAHRYASAWALADQTMRDQVGGYAAFESQMSPVRSITFQRDQVLSSSSDSATVGIQTTSVQTDRTQHCSGTARAVRSGGAWLLDGISITC